MRNPYVAHVSAEWYLFTRILNLREAEGREGLSDGVGLGTNLYSCLCKNRHILCSMWTLPW